MESWGIKGPFFRKEHFEITPLETKEIKVNALFFYPDNVSKHDTCE